MLTLTTERLTLRNFFPSDAPALAALVTRYQATPPAAWDHPWPTDSEAIRGVVQWFASGDAFLAVCLRESGELIGHVALNSEESPDTLNLGYLFDAAYHGRGYATEACRALLDNAFRTRGIARIVTCTAAANGPSCRLLARLGFVRTGESTCSFRTDPSGVPITFLGWSFELSRGDWEGKGQ